MRTVVLVTLSVALLTTFGCAALTQIDKASYEEVKALAQQRKISYPLAAGCYDGWGEFRTIQTPTPKDPIILKNLYELSDLLNTASVTE